MITKKHKGSLEHILCFVAIAIACIISIVLINLSSYNMRKEQVENFVTDSTLSGAVIDVSRFQLTGHISNYDIEKTYNNFTTCLKDNLNLGTEIRQNGVIVGFKGNDKDLVISNKNDAVSIMDFYLYNAEFENDDDEPGVFNVIKYIENGQVYKDAKEVIFAENADYATVTLSKSIGKNKIVKLNKNTTSVYVCLAIKLKSFNISFWGNDFSTDTVTGIHEYLVDVTRNNVDYVNDEEHTDDEHNFVLKNIIDATCETTGLKEYACDCGKTYTEKIDKKGHTEIKGGEQNIHSKCKVCGKTLSTEHQYSSSITKEAECGKTGEKTYTCDCGYSYIEEIEALKHVIINGGTKEAHTKCSICDEIISNQHDFKEKVTHEATCTEDGIIEYTCDCGYSYTKNIGTIEHNYIEEEVEKSVCTEESYIIHRCLTCGHEYKEITEEAGEHEEWDIEVIKEATCIEKGEEKRTCKKCGHIEIVVTELTDHEYEDTVVPPTCKEGDEGLGYTVHICLICGHEYKDNYVQNSPDDHIEDYAGREDAHTECIICGKILSDEHDFTIEIISEPTCTEAGEKKYTCECGYTYNEIINPLGHTEIFVGDQNIHSKCDICKEILNTNHLYVNKITKEPTCTETGIKTYTCECGYTYDEDIEAFGHIEGYASTSTPKDVSWLILSKTNFENNGNIYSSNNHEASSTAELMIEITASTNADYTLPFTVSSEPSYDKLYIYLDNNLISGPYSGIVDSEFNLSLTEGVHILKIQYKKDGNVDKNDDKCTISFNDIVFGNDATLEVHTKCLRCGITLSSTHNYTYNVVIEPTCTTTGIGKYSCECGYTYIEDIAALGHASVSGGTTNIHTKCSRCGITLTTTHTFTETTEIQPTCTVKGTTRYTCSCGYTYKSQNIPALGHVEVNGGTKEIHTKCSRCYKVLNTIHSFTIKVIKEPTYTETGIRTCTCECGYSYTEDIPLKSGTFAEMSWTDISIVSKIGRATSMFNVGDKKELIIGSETYHVQILGFNHDDLSDGSGKAGITVGLKEVLTTTFNMNAATDGYPYGDNIGGWRDCEMRTYINRDFYNSLPQEVKNIIKPVNKLTSEGNMSSTIITTSDKLFLLSEIEVFGSVYYSVSGEGSQYQYFANGGSKNKYNLANSRSAWWLRSPYIRKNDYFCAISSSGSTASYFSYDSEGVVPCFCI